MSKYDKKKITINVSDETRERIMALCEKHNIPKFRIIELILLEVLDKVEKKGFRFKNKCNCNK